jgi:hypothetical protein
MVEGLAGRQLVRIRRLVCGKSGTSCDHESLEMPFSPMRPSMPGLSRVGESTGNRSHQMQEVFGARGKPFEHEADGRQVDEGFRRLDLQLVVFAQAAISGQPAQTCAPRSKSGPEGALRAFGDKVMPRSAIIWTTAIIWTRSRELSLKVRYHHHTPAVLSSGSPCLRANVVEQDHRRIEQRVRLLGASSQWPFIEFRGLVIEPIPSLFCRFAASVSSTRAAGHRWPWGNASTIKGFGMN